MVSSREKVRAFLALPRAGAIFLGLVAVIVGVLAMHVWMGGHGPGHGPTAAHGPHIVIGTGAMFSESMAPAAGPPTGSGNEADLAAANGSADTSEMVQGCGGFCGNDSAALGLCVLAFIVVTILALLIPAGRLVPGTVLLRGPPQIRLRPLSIPVPSLIQLCISRT